jgi:hypothetical protein
MTTTTDDYPVVIVTDDGERPLTADEAARYERDRATWQRAYHVAALARLTADWLEGKSLYLPAYGAANPDPETTPLTGRLAAYNRAGFMTVDSQPGTDPEPGHDGWIWAQRAAVSGFCAPDAADQIEDALFGREALFGRDELCVRFARPRTRPLRPIPVTIRANPDDPTDTRAATVSGVRHGVREIREMYRGELNPVAVQDLCESWQVMIVDQEFGAHQRVWDALDQALGVRVGTCPAQARTDPARL